MGQKQRVVITGAGTGIGRAIALRFAANGDEVLLIGRRPHPLLEVQAEIGKAQASVTAVDCADAKELKKAIDNFAMDGGLDVLIANAGINPQRANALDANIENWQQTFDVNLNGVHFACQASLKHMLANKAGAIVTIGSIAGLSGMKDRAAYGPSKAAVANYTKALAVDFGDRGIRANCVCPGFVITDINRDWLNQLPADKRHNLETRHVLGLGAPEQVAEAVFYLASPAASWITGVELPVDGGWRAS